MSENKVTAKVVFDSREDTSLVPNQEIVKKAVCAVSGGMDSATCLYHAVKLYGKDNVIGVSMYYGQKHDIELKAAKAECERLGVKHYEMNLTPIFSFNKNISALLEGSEKEIAQNKSYSELMKEKVDKGEAPISDEYIPNRNSLFANTLCAVGLQVFENHPFALFLGIHADDALTTSGSNIQAYPDCSLEFAVATNKALQLSTSGLCYIYTPLVNKTKTQVAEFGTENGMDSAAFSETWSCYLGAKNAKTKNGHYLQCSRCPTCADRIHALVGAKVITKVSDITEYYDCDEERAEKYLTGESIA